VEVSDSLGVPFRQLVLCGETVWCSCCKFCKLLSDCLGVPFGILRFCRFWAFWILRFVWRMDLFCFGLRICGDRVFLIYNKRILFAHVTCARRTTPPRPAALPLRKQVRKFFFHYNCSFPTPHTHPLPLTQYTQCHASCRRGQGSGRLQFRLVHQCPITEIMLNPALALALRQFGLVIFSVFFHYTCSCRNFQCRGLGYRGSSGVNGDAFL